MRLLDKIEDDVCDILFRFGIPSHVVLGEAEASILYSEIKEKTGNQSLQKDSKLAGYRYVVAGHVKFVFTNAPTVYHIVCEVPPKTDVEMIEAGLVDAVSGLPVT